MEVTGPTSTICKARKLRRALSLPEVILWQQLRTRPASLKLGRQHPAGPYIRDFYADAVRLAVEVDGEAHNRGGQPARDIERDVWLSRRGVSPLRIPAAAVLADLDSVLRHIVETARAAGFAGPPPPAGED
ncbi:endonuclease domain-containing protein [Sphingomonas sp.]|jgi:very-short-patch-repair endonuclease|uniref:endonuclease domain-containing protein n=1 Tax=Sphingomonas sp. TaxID=28214 RepID=UPI002D7FC1C3|nr:DUF559 domain-containing protein [Sphingomonas sp.]HEU0043578.1 DUF559 domain-containing protein [Sphingomonas sp.]